MIQDERLMTVKVRQFCIATTAVSSLFWALGAIIPVELVADGLPVSAGMFVAPAIAVWFTRAEAPSLTFPRSRGMAWRAARSSLAWLPLMPVILGCSLLLMLVSGDDVPSPLGPAPATVLSMCLVFTFTSVCEEVGWSRFLTPALLTRAAPVRVGIAIGALWAALHVVPYVQADRSGGWIAWQVLFTVAFRVLIVAATSLSRASWLVAVALHASYDVAWVSMPVGGSSYDPLYVAPLTALAAVAALGTLNHAHARAFSMDDDAR